MSAPAAAAAVANSTSREFINDLYELLEQDEDPTNTVILELILEQWTQLGDIQTASGVAQEILRRDPSHAIAQQLIQASAPQLATSPMTATSSVFSPGESPSTSTSSLSGRQRSTVSDAGDGGPTSPSGGGRVLDLALRSRGAVATQKSNRRAIMIRNTPKTEKEVEEMEAELAACVVLLRHHAAELEGEMAVLENVGLVDNTTVLQDIHDLKEGRVSLVVLPPMPRPVRSLVRSLRGDRGQCLGQIVDDFSQVAQWAMEENVAVVGGVGGSSSHVDKVRERLRRRQALLDAMLPPELEGLGRAAMMQVEHQMVQHGKKYANDKTMLLENVADIPAANLLVTSDNYAWDMAELADALAANSGVMRNPLTRDMFSEDDVRQILSHPLGDRLRPLGVAQDKLKRGVRPATIERIAHLSRVMLEDQSAHATPTIEAIDVFMVYFYTLPEAEKKTLKSLKVPAKDSHTGAAYDSAIFEAIEDAKANRVCFHKAGDFLRQAALYLAAGK